MALLKCPDCLNDVSDAAPSCPKCGRLLAAGRVALAAGGAAPKRSLNTVKLVGAGLTIVSVFGACGLGSSLGGGWWAIGAGAVCVSLLVFLVGRFYD